MWLEQLLHWVHGLSAAAWFGAIFYRTLVVDPKAFGFFPSRSDYEHFSTHLAHGMRYLVTGRPRPHTRPCETRTGERPPMAGLLDQDRIVAPPGYNRWLVIPAALAIHLSIGVAYGFSVFWRPLERAVGVTAPVACPGD